LFGAQRFASNKSYLFKPKSLRAELSKADSAFKDLRRVMFENRPMIFLLWICLDGVVDNLYIRGCNSSVQQIDFIISINFCDGT